MRENRSEESEAPKKRAPRKRKADLESSAEIDVAALPPSIVGSDGDEESAKPKPKRASRARKAQPQDDDKVSVAG